MSKAILAVTLLVLLAPSLAGCREAEQGRTLDFNKGVYQGRADEKLGAEQTRTCASASSCSAKRCRAGPGAETRAGRHRPGSE